MQQLFVFSFTPLILIIPLAPLLHSYPPYLLSSATLFTECPSTFLDAYLYVFVQHFHHILHYHKSPRVFLVAVEIDSVFFSRQIELMWPTFGSVLSLSYQRRSSHVARLAAYFPLLHSFSCSGSFLSSVAKFTRSSRQANSPTASVDSSSVGILRRYFHLPLPAASFFLYMCCTVRVYVRLWRPSVIVTNLRLSCCLFRLL